MRVPFSGLDSHRDLGLLVLRVGIGVAFMAHGLPKLTAGPDAWAGYGQAMSNLGITFAPTFWGLMAGLAEGLGGAALVLGLFTRVAAAFMAFTMAGIVAGHVQHWQGFVRASHPVEMFVVFVGLFILGPGRHSLDAKLR
jgi:putative oxidoreductase